MTTNAQNNVGAVAVFQGTNNITGIVTFKNINNNCQIKAQFTSLPHGKHGFHIHRSGDLRGEGCVQACEHYHKGPPQSHGDEPSKTNLYQERHTGDLGNIEGPEFKKTYLLPNVSVEELWGRTLIVHEDPDDLGLGPFEDSLTTGHSGKRIGCALIGRIDCANSKKTTNKNRQKHV